MNLAEIDTDLSKELVTRDKKIGFIVFKGTYTWIIDWSDYFTLDQQKNIDALCSKEECWRRYLPAGMTLQQWNKKLQSEFRGGIPSLTAELFPRYRDGETAKVVTTDMLRDEFFSEDTGQYTVMSSEIEAELSFNTPMTEELVLLRMRLFSRLPKFYINYDRKIYMHMVRDRFYENAILDGWWGAEGDFEHMIPTSHRYWVRNTNEDYWAVTNFSNG